MKLFLSILLPAAAFAQIHDKALAPIDARNTFQLEPGLKVELVVSEPDVVAPCALAFDEAGRMYVAENRGYPTDFGKGRIALFEMRNGKVGRRSEFADGLDYPNGVLPWASGLIVTCAPDVLFLKDTDGDGRADLRQIILTGFSTNGSTQLRVSHPTLSPDHWIYLSGGLSGGKITSPLSPQQAAIDISRSEIRFRLTMDQSGKAAAVRFEAVDGKGQFGLSFDDFGHRFTCMNRVQAQEIVLPSRYLKRNPNLAFSDSMQDLPEDRDPGLRVGPPAAHIFPISHNLTTADSHLGTFTAACGVTVYRGDALPEGMYGNIFSCDPAANLVHRDVLFKRGATHVARRTTERAEFLASSDDWFRPVFLQTGPDGALYICDMYRRSIEHPVYLPEEVRKKTDFESGRDCGRIWRVYSDKKPLEFRNLISMYVGQLRWAMDSRISWHQEMAQRRYLDRTPGDSSLAVLNSRFNTPEGRARALRLKAELNLLKPAQLEKAFADSDPGVREVAVELSEPFLNDSPALTKKIRKLAADSDSHVRFRTALALGEIHAKSNIVETLGRIARMPLDRWMTAAILSSSCGIEYDLLRSVLKSDLSNTDAEFCRFLEQLSFLASKANKHFDSMPDLSKKPLSIQFTVLNGVAEGKGSLNQSGNVDVSKLIKTAKEIVGDSQGSSSIRIAALRFLRWTANIPQGDILPLLTPANSPELQRVALQFLLKNATAATIKTVMTGARWSELSPELQEQFVSGVISNPQLAPALLEAVAEKQVSPSAISPALRRQLQNSKDAVIKEKALTLFKSSERDRMKIYEDYKSVLQEKADPLNGRKVFSRACATCHRLDQDGTPVGPDLFSMRNQPKEAILLHVIVPDYEIALGFNNYTIELKDGRTLSGIIRSENDSAITVRSTTGKDEPIPRAGILSLQASKNSMMPQDLEKTMTRQELADLIAYVKGE